MTKLMIVESPAKVKKIKSFLGEGWRVEASMGHVRDLPTSDLGVVIADGFRPDYRILKGQENTVRRLLRAIKQAEAVYLATDPDREGEAIAWHILELARPPKKKPIYRVTFNAITKSAVLAAVEAPRQLDTNLVEAQQTRRIVDRLVGYMVSSLVCRALNGRYSAGRVQSVCLRLVVEREREVRHFQSKRYWTLDAKLNTLGGSLTARLVNIKGTRVEQFTAEQVEGLTRNLAGSVFWVSQVEVVEKNRRPAPPFTTSSLQQAASKALSLSPDQTMRLAQILYEAGYITYMRTDGVAIAPEAQEVARQFIGLNYGAEYVPEPPQTYEARMDNAQESHEGIRPADLSRPPASLGSGQGAELYALIWNRFIASQMADARYSHTHATILIGKGLGKPYPMEFAVQGRTLLFDGFLKVYQEALDEGEEGEDHPTLPELANNQALQFVEWLKQEHTTKAPPRYTEAALVQALEQRGVGRPSTFASMVKLIKDKGYARLDKKRFVPTPQGTALFDFLVEHFPRIFDYDYTSHLETELDRIASGDATRLGILMSFWEAFDPALKAAGQVVEERVAARLQPKPTGQNCPKCGGLLVEKQSRNGPFIGCSNYPDCNFTTAIGRFIGVTSGN
jgi:DNA topoisomerase-1